jgi:exopolysaccharide production protein ExoY
MTQFFNSQNVKVRHIPFKRIFDILFSISVFTLGSPFFIILFLLIKLSSKGPALYGQARIGRGGKCFLCLKFRTMYPDADSRLQILLKENPNLKKEWEENFKLKNDPRVTPIGRFLRKTSLDELPQFWNVLKGDLSVVGPRPLVRTELQRFLGKRAEKILSVRPGLTCFWQVSGRNDISYQNRIELDEYYVDTRSNITDILLIIKTIKHMIQPKGAY